MTPILLRIVSVCCAKFWSLPLLMTGQLKCSISASNFHSPARNTSSQTLQVYRATKNEPKEIDFKIPASVTHNSKLCNWADDSVAYVPKHLSFSTLGTCLGILPLLNMASPPQILFWIEGWQIWIFLVVTNCMANTFFLSFLKKDPCGWLGEKLLPFWRNNPKHNDLSFGGWENIPQLYGITNFFSSFTPKHSLVPHA